MAMNFDFDEDEAKAEEAEQADDIVGKMKSSISCLLCLQYALPLFLDVCLELSCVASLL